MDCLSEDDGQGWDGSDADICGCGDSVDRIDEDCPNYPQHMRDLGL